MRSLSLVLLAACGAAAKPAAPPAPPAVVVAEPAPPPAATVVVSDGVATVLVHGYFGEPITVEVTDRAIVVDRQTGEPASASSLATISLRIEADALVVEEVATIVPDCPSGLITDTPWQ